jgi:hypothetical protein
MPKETDMNWFWLNIPLATLIFLVMTVIPIWLVFRHPDTGPQTSGPARRAAGGPARRAASSPAAAPVPVPVPAVYRSASAGRAEATRDDRAARQLDLAGRS